MTASKRILIAGGTLVGACVIWMVTASLLLCMLGHRMDAFVWPYDQWLDAAPHWRANWLMTLGIVFSAAMPTVVLLAVGVWIVRMRIGRKPRALYGDSGWARAGEQRANGVRQSARLP